MVIPMINLKHHLSNYTIHPDLFLSEKVASVWRYLNKEKIKSTDAKTSGKSITDKAQEFLTMVQSPGHEVKYGQLAARRHQRLMNAILEPGVLEAIITSEPKQLADYARDLDAKLVNDDFVKTTARNSFSELLMSNVFNYKTYRDSKFCADLYISLYFSNATCPYCNEYPVKVVQRINTKDKKLTLHFDLDHFYPKHHYPYLALSFYNHIPSCKYCNSLHKLQKKFAINTHIHPYVDHFDDFYDFEYSKHALRGEKVKEVRLKKKNAPFVDNLCAELELEDRYQSNLDYARINHLIEILADNSHLLFTADRNADDELKRLQIRLADFGLINTRSQILQKPWSKMQRDLVKLFDVNNVLLKD